MNVKKWLTVQEHAKLIAEVDAYLESEREIAVNSPMPAPETAEGGTTRAVQERLLGLA